MSALDKRLRRVDPFYLPHTKSDCLPMEIRLLDLLKNRQKERDRFIIEQIDNPPVLLRLVIMPDILTDRPNPLFMHAIPLFMGDH